MWKVYYDNGVDPVVELGTFESKKQAIVVKKTFIFNHSWRYYINLFAYSWFNYKRINY